MNSERRASKVPTGRVSRFLQIGVTASRMAAGGVAEKTRRALDRALDASENALLTRDNALLLADRLSRLRGAAMKLGQMLSMEGDNMLPPEFARALERLRASGDRMPESQVLSVLDDQYGESWRELFESVDLEPLASASIGQVHRAVAKDGRVAALKLQYPGIARSIDSDVDNLASLLGWAKLLPGQIDVDAMSAEVKRQLKEEVDYTRELQQLLRYQEELSKLAGHRIRVAEAYPDLCRPQVLATELVAAPPLLEWAKTARQEERDAVATELLGLLLREFFQMALMQTDPNPSNYLYDEATGQIVLLDFGATRAVPPAIQATYRSLLHAVALNDSSAMGEALESLGVFPRAADTAPEVRQLMVELGMMLEEVLARDEAYDFLQSTLSDRMAKRARGLIRHHRHVQPPPPQFLFFQRKLGGSFLIARALRARVNCHRLLFECGLLESSGSGPRRAPPYPPGGAGAALT